MTVEAGEPQGSPPGRRRRGYWIPGLIALAAMLAIGVAFGAGDLVHSAPSTLHGQDVASEIALAMQARQHLTTAPDVRCPQSEPVRSHLVFECVLVQGKLQTTITVTEIDNRGHLQWFQPLTSG
jgi:hypothetical protein